MGKLGKLLNAFVDSYDPAAKGHNKIKGDPLHYVTIFP